MKSWSWLSVSILIGCFFFLSRGGISSASSDGEQLFHRLFSNYSKHIRPVRHLGDVTNVTFYLTLLQLISVTEKTEEMTTSQYITMRWEDRRLTWDPKMFGGITQIRVPSHKVWKPDLALHNNNDGKYDTSVPVNALLNFTGKLEWLPAALYRSACKIKVDLFPFDWQNCTLKFKSFAYDKSELYIKSAYNKVVLDKEAYMDNGEWNIIHCPIKTTEDPSNDKYQDITVNFILKRRPLFYVNQIICPCVLISWLSVLVFILPSASSEKMTMGISVLLGLTVYLLLLAKRVPETSLGIPLIGAYLLFTMVTVTLSIVFSVFVLNFHHCSRPSSKMSPLFHSAFIVILPRILGMEKPKSARCLLVEQSKTMLDQDECGKCSDNKTDGMKVEGYNEESEEDPCTNECNCVLKKDTVLKPDCLKTKKDCRKEAISPFKCAVRNSNKNLFLEVEGKSGLFKNNANNSVINTLSEKCEKNFYLQIPKKKTFMPVIECHREKRRKKHEQFSENKKSLKAERNQKKLCGSASFELSCLCDKNTPSQRRLAPLSQPLMKRSETVSGIPSLCPHQSDNTLTSKCWSHFRDTKNELQNKSDIKSLLSVAQTIDMEKLNFSQSPFSTSLEDFNSGVSREDEVIHNLQYLRQNQRISTGNVNLCISDHNIPSPCSDRTLRLTPLRKHHLPPKKLDHISCKADLKKSFTRKRRLKQETQTTRRAANNSSNSIQESFKFTPKIESSNNAANRRHLSCVSTHSTSSTDSSSFSQEIGIAMEAVKYISDTMRSADEKDVTLEDWHFVANVWDRLCFIFFLLTFIFGTLAFLLLALLNRVPEYPFDNEDPKYANCDKI